MNSTCISIHITPEQSEKLERLIKEYEIRNKSEAIRLALAFYFKYTIDKEE